MEILREHAVVLFSGEFRHFYPTLRIILKQCRAPACNQPARHINDPRFKSRRNFHGEVMVGGIIIYEIDLQIMRAKPLHANEGHEISKTMQGTWTIYGFINVESA